MTSCRTSPLRRSTSSLAANSAINSYAPASTISKLFISRKDSAASRSLLLSLNTVATSRLQFHITEGPRDIVNTLSIEGANTFPESQFAPKGSEGSPRASRIRKPDVQADRASIIANYLKAGYLTSSFRETATQVSKDDPHHINVVYHIYEGPRVFTGDILTLGRVHTQQRLINDDIAIIKPDQPLTETDLLTAGQQSLQPYRRLRLV